MLILGIETSCDETAVAIVKNGRKILANAICSQINLHKKTGGVVPEVAAREHVIKIAPTLDEALSKARVKMSDIDAFAATNGPGLLSSLIIGVNAAMTLSAIFRKPLIPVNHIEGHIYANWLKSAPQRGLAKGDSKPQFPIAVLTVSGGHNELILWKNHGEYKFLGATLDDAAGEAFDKVSRLLGLGYPGGPAIQKAAMKGRKEAHNLPRSWLHPTGALFFKEGNKCNCKKTCNSCATQWDFSFSGLKTAVLRLVKEYKFTNKEFAADVAASFQEAVCEVLAVKLIAAAKKYKVKEIHLAGGVSANLRLREWTQGLLPPKMKLRFCNDLSLCTDNAAMIAAAGYFKFKKNPAKYKTWRPVITDPNLQIKNW